MRTRRSLLLAGVVIGILMLTRPPSAQPPVPLASFYGIGDLPGGLTTSIVRDATKVGGTIYAVGSSAAAANPNLDTAAIWTFDGANPATLTELPLNTLGGGGPTAAAAITPGAAGASFIASQARYSVSGPRSDGGVSTLTRIQPVRVERTATYPTENLNAAPFPTYVSTISLIGGLTAILPTNSSAVAISDDGSILYGATQQTIGASTFGRAVRFDFSNLPGDNVLIPLLNPGDTTNGPAARGTSADGSVMVGVSFGGPAGANAFRYEHGNPGTVALIPRLPGGTGSRAAAVSPDGNLTLVVGTSGLSVSPQNEMYLHDALTGAITRLGSPNTAWAATGSPGMTDDGLVVAASFGCVTPCSTQNRYAYFRNSRGWFRLESALAAQGVFLPNLGWFDLQITGISRDGTLVFGQGMHNGNPEGFVAEFALDYLKDFDVPAVSPTDTSIVGAWVFASPDGDPSLGVFLADGTYFMIESGLNEPDSADGFERGRYFWNPQTQAFAVETLVDTNGADGLSGANGVDGTTVAVSGADITLTFPVWACDGTPADPCVYTATRVVSSPGSLAGAWYGGNPTLADSSRVLVLLDDGSYYFAQDGDSSPAGDPNGIDGIEKGTWTWNAVTGNFSTSTTVDTNRDWGLNAQFPLPGSQDTLTVQLTPDGLGLVAPGFTNLTRVIDPATIPVITSPLTANGAAGQPFAYPIAATNATSYSASTLPGGLSLNTGTGEITGTPANSGTSTVTIAATNSEGISDIEELTLTIAIPPPVAPTITWATPGDMSYGTPLSATQLNATANVSGTFVYTPAAGTVLGLGTGQTLSVTFTPDNLTLYTTASATVSINVVVAPPCDPSFAVPIGTITTFAGSGAAGFSGGGFGGDGGVATSALLKFPNAIATDDTYFYIADTNNHRIRRVHRTTCTIDTVAGNGTAGFLGDAGAASAARLNAPRGVAVANGILYIADTNNHRVRAVNLSTGIISTVAGNNNFSIINDGGPATAAGISGPFRVHVANGQLYIADRGNNRIRRVDLGTNIISTVAGNGTGAFAGDGGAATSASLNLPTDMVVGNGALYIADRQNARVRRVNLSTGIITTIAGDGGFGASGIGPSGLALAGNRLYISDDGTARVQELNLTTGVRTTIAGTLTTGFSGDGGSGTAALLDQPGGLLLSSNALFIADIFNQRIRRLQLKAEQAALTIVAPATAEFDTTVNISVTGGSGSGALSVVATGACTLAGADTITMTSGVGTCTVTASKAGDASYFAASASPAVITAVRATPSVSWATPAGLTYGTAIGPTQLNATAGVPGTFDYVPASGAVLGAGSHTLAVTFTPNNATQYEPVTRSVTLAVAPAALLVTPDNQTRWAGLSNPTLTYTFTGFVLGETAAVIGGSPSITTTATAASAPGTYPITATTGTLFSPNYAFTFAAGTLTIELSPCDAAYARPIGEIMTIAGSGAAGFSGGGFGGDGSVATSALLKFPNAIATDDTYFYIADTNNHRIRRVHRTTCLIDTVAGNGTAGFLGDAGAASAARLNAPRGVAVANGILYIADTNNHRVRAVNLSTGIISTVAGNNNFSIINDGGPATAAGINGPFRVHVANGQLYIADRGNNRIRRVDLGTNIISTVAGNGTGVFAGDGGAATSASLNLPTDMVVGNGALYIADRQNARVRRVDLSTGIITTIAGNGGFGASGIGPSGLALAGNRLYISDDGTARVQELDLTTGAMTTVAGTITTGFIGDGGQGTAAKLDQPAGLLLSSNALFIADTFNQRIRRLQLKAEQAPLIVTAPATAVFGTTVTIDVTGGSSTGAITLAASGACTVAGADSVTMTSGVGTCSVVATKAGDAAYFSTTSVPVLIAAVNATPTVSWPTPADVTYGTALSTTQLSATASVSGTFQYTPAAGGYLNAGINQTLSVLFTPTDTSRYSQASASVSITVNPATLQVTATSKERQAGTANPPLTYTVTGFVRSETTAVLTGAPALSTTATLASPAGAYPITITQGTLTAANYAFSFVNGTMTVTAPPPFLCDPGVIPTVGTIDTFAGSGPAGVLAGSFGGDGNLATGALMRIPHGIAVSGNHLYIADSQNLRVRRVNLTTCVIDTVAGTGVFSPDFTGDVGDGRAATSALLASPSGVAVYGTKLLIADTNQHRIRQVDLTTGIITTIAGNGTGAFAGDGGPATAASLRTPRQISVDGDLLYIADEANHRIRHVNLLTGIIETVAGNGVNTFAGDGGAAIAASLNLPGDAIAANGLLFVADNQNRRVRRVDLSTGIITTIAGTGGSGGAGDGGPATSASLIPSGLAIVDGALIVADQSQRVRQIDLTTGTITTIAGTGAAGFDGDGAAGTAATLDFPADAAVHGRALFIADRFNNRVRRLQLRLAQAMLTVTAPTAATFGTSFNVSASGGSSTGGLTFNVGGACQLSNGNLVTMTSGTGACDITATRASDSQYIATTSAIWTVTAERAAQVPLAITGAPTSAVLGASFVVTITGGSGNGAQTLTATGACEADVQDPLAIAITAPVGTCSLTATQNGDANYLDAAATPISVTVADSTPPVAVIAAPTADALIATATTTVLVDASDASGIVGVTVNSVAATRISGTPQSGRWEAIVPINLAAASASFNVTAIDAASNPASTSLVIDNDGIDSAIDRARNDYNVDQSGTFSLQFNDGVTSGAVTGTRQQYAISKPGSTGVRIALPGTGTVDARVCNGTDKYVRLDVTGEIADASCNGNTVTVTAVAASTAIQVYKQTTGTYYQTYTQCYSYRCGFFGSCTNCYPVSYPVTYTYYYRIDLAQGQSVSTGSPIVADPANDTPLVVTLVQVGDDGLEMEVGSFELDPGESAEVTEVTPGPDRADTLELTVLDGEVEVTFNGEVTTLTEGTHPLERDLTAPIAALSSTAPNPTGAPIPVTVTFTEPVIGFDASVVQVTNGTISSFAGSGAVYTFVVTAAAPGDVTITIPAAAVGDAAGNINTAASLTRAFVNKQSQSVSFGPLANVAYGSGPLTLVAVATSGLPVSFTATGSCSVSGTTLTGLGVGLCTVTASQDGNDSYFAATNVVQSFRIIHSWSGLLQPINDDGSSIFKQGSTIPVKFQLAGGSAGLTTLGARLYLTRTSNGVVGTELEAESNAAADSGNTFRYAGGQYIFNLSTKSMQAGTWQLRVDLLDGESHILMISLDK